MPERPLWRAALGTVFFVTIGPGTVVGVVPWLILRSAPGPMLPGWLRWVGLVPLIPGAALLFDSWVRFVVRGRGTPAPVAPPQRLVVSGVYRWVRNPMYVGIVLVLLGEAFLARSGSLLAWAAVVWLAFHVFVTLYEEPHLARTFGTDYAEYRRSVQRWFPRPPAGRLL